MTHILAEAQNLASHFTRATQGTVQVQKKAWKCNTGSRPSFQTGQHAKEGLQNLRPLATIATNGQRAKQKLPLFIARMAGALTNVLHFVADGQRLAAGKTSMRDQGRQTQGQSVQSQVYTFKLAQGVLQDYMAGLQRMISAVNKLADATRYMLAPKTKALEQQRNKPTLLNCGELFGSCFQSGK